MDKPKSFSAHIPFSGFYYTTHSEAIDSEEDGFFEYGDGSSLPSELADKYFEGNDGCDYKAVNEKYAKEYASRLANKLEITIEYEEMVSPREYNFQTDRIFGRISRSDLAKMLWKVRGKRLKDKMRLLCTSRPGFISFYSNELCDWGRISTWDHNQIRIVLLAYIEMFCEESSEYLDEYDLECDISTDISAEGIISQWLYEHASDWGKWAILVSEFLKNFRDNSHPYFPCPF